MAAKFWPGEEPIGKRFHLYNLTEPLLEVVGVARDSKYVVVFESPRPYVYLPIVRDMSLRTLHRARVRRSRRARAASRA